MELSRRQLEQLLAIDEMVEEIRQDSGRVVTLKPPPPAYDYWAMMWCYVEVGPYEIPDGDLEAIVTYVNGVYDMLRVVRTSRKGGQNGHTLQKPQILLDLCEKFHIDPNVLGG